MRYMYVITSAEKPTPPTPALLEAMHAMATREIAAGRMVDDGGLTPVAMGARITCARGKVAVIDGPFAETKEVIAGFAVFEVDSREDGLALGVEFMQLHADHQPGWEGAMEMREVAGSETRPVRGA